MTSKIAVSTSIKIRKERVDLIKENTMKIGAVKIPIYAITEISRRRPCNIAPKNSEQEHENPQKRLKVIKYKRITSNATIQNSRYIIYNMPLLNFFTMQSYLFFDKKKT